MGSQKVGRAKENSRIHLKIQKDPHLGKKTQGPKNIPNGLEAPRASLNGSKIAKETPSSWTESWLDLGGQWPPLIFFLNIIKYMGTNFSNFVLENYTFVPLKISLIILRALL